MTQTRAELKSRARQLLIGKYGTVIGASLLAGLVSLTFTWLFDIIVPFGFEATLSTASLSASVIAVMAYVIIALLITILASGIYFFYLNIARDKPYRISDIFDGFLNQPDRVILAELRVMLICLLYALPFIFVFIAIAFALQENKALLIASIYLALAIYIFVILSVRLRYELVFYLRADHPEYSAAKLVEESRWLMTGNRWAYCKLQLSFLGLIFLGILSLGIGLLWVQAYMRMTNALFYLNLCENKSDTQQAP